MFNTGIHRDPDFAVSQYLILKQTGKFEILLFLSSIADNSRQQNRAVSNSEVRIATVTPFIAPRRLQMPLVHALTVIMLFTTLHRQLHFNKPGLKIP